MRRRGAEAITRGDRQPAAAAIAIAQVSQATS
jgi:hypothetical protein